jgi:hypothetical protein
MESRDSIVGLMTGYWLDDRCVGVRVPVGLRIFSSPRRPDRLWDPPSLLSNGYRGLFPRGQSGQGVKLTTHLQLVPRSRKRGSIHPLPHTPSWRRAWLVKRRDNVTFLPDQNCTLIIFCRLVTPHSDSVGEFHAVRWNTFHLWSEQPVSFGLRVNFHISPCKARLLLI